MLLWTFMYQFLGEHMPSIFISIYFGVKIQSHMVNLICLTAKLFPKMAASFYIPATMYESSNCSTSSPTLIVISLFNYSHSSRYEVVFNRDFSLHFSNGLWCWTFFHILIIHLFIFLEERFILIFHSFLNWVLCLFIVRVVRNSFWAQFPLY